MMRQLGGLSWLSLLPKQIIALLALNIEWLTQWQGGSQLGAII